MTEEEKRALLSARNEAERLADHAWLRHRRAKSVRARGLARKAWRQAEADARALREACLELDSGVVNA